MELSNEEIEEVLSALSSAANFMRGMAFDPTLDGNQQTSLNKRASEIDEVIEKYGYR